MRKLGHYLHSPTFTKHFENYCIHMLFGLETHAKDENNPR